MSHYVHRQRMTKAAAFTLVELLVVIGIIGLLIAILLPALEKARQQADSIKCMAGLRNIGIGLADYISSYNGWIPGGPITTGAFNVNANGWTVQGSHPKVSLSNTTPSTQSPGFNGLCGVYDFYSPLAQLMNYRFNWGNGGQDAIQRWYQLNNSGAFTCPSNNLVAVYYSSSIPFPTGKYAGGLMPSYVESMVFQQSGYICHKYGVYVGGGDCTIPADYVPQITKIGKAAVKIFAADGARWCSDADGTLPDVALGWGEPGTSGDTNQTVAFADPGPWDTYGHSWMLDAESGNSTSKQPLDCRPLAYRHGFQKPFGQTNSYKMNALFFDGHVESLGDLESSNPTFWNPRGTIIPKSSVYTNTWNAFSGGASGQFVVSQ